MKYVYQLLFEKKPENLESVLADMGFELETVCKKYSFPMYVYKHPCGFELNYHDGTYGDEHYTLLPNIEAQASVAISTEDKKRVLEHKRIAQKIREFYDAAIYEPAKRKMLD